MNKHPLYKAYREQSRACTNRKDRNGNQIEMKLSFDEWLSIWEASGHLHERGLGSGKYVMSRINDLGHYELSNVCIKSYIDNIIEGNREVPRPSNIIITPAHAYDLSLRPVIHLRKHSLDDSQLMDIILRHERGESWNSISRDYTVSVDTIRQTIYQIKYSYPIL
jgi:hypothetical protein